LAQAAGRGQRAGPVAGDENPADDTASLPYLLSTQILLWHTAMRLAAREGELGIGELGLTAQADTVRAAIRDASPARGRSAASGPTRPTATGGTVATTTPTTSRPPWHHASLLGDTDRADDVLGRLLAVAAPDGLLPETSDPDTGAWLARHWFAWPSAVLAALALGSVGQIGSLSG
jgi:hypothetical protein